MTFTPKAKSRFTPKTKIQNREIPVSGVDRMAAAQESRTLSHPDLLKEAILKDKDLGFGGVGRGMKALGGVIQRGTAMAVNPMIEAQRGQKDPKEYIKSVGKGFTGERLGEIGDLYVGAGAPEPLAAGLGLATETALVAPKALTELPMAIKNAPKYLRGVAERISAQNAEKTLAGLSRKSDKARALAGKLVGETEEAVKTAGATQGGIVDLAGSDLRSKEAMNKIIENLPAPLKEEILSSPHITRSKPISYEPRGFTRPFGSESTSIKPTVVKGAKPYTVEEFPASVIEKKEVRGLRGGLESPAYSEAVTGADEIEPTVKNLETIRGIIRGRVPSSKFNLGTLDWQSRGAIEGGYRDIGRLMSEGNQEIADAFKLYRGTKAAGKKIMRPLVDVGTGEIKPLGMKSLLDKDENVQSLIKLSEQNPEIARTVQKIKKYQSGQAVKNYLKDQAVKYGPVTALGFLGLEGIRRNVRGSQRYIVPQ